MQNMQSGGPLRWLFKFAIFISKVLAPAAVGAGIDWITASSGGWLILGGIFSVIVFYAIALRRAIRKNPYNNSFVQEGRRGAWEDRKRY